MNRANYFGRIVFVLLYCLLCRYVISVLEVSGGMITDICMYLVTVTAVWNFKNRLFSYKKCIDNRKIVYLLSIVFFFYFAFALSGNVLFVYPIEMRVTFVSILKYLAVTVWGIPICIACLNGLYMISYSMRSTTKERMEIHSKRKVFLICFGIVSLVSTFYLIGFNPAISTSDTVNQFQQAKGLIPLSNWHTPFHTLFIRLALSLYDSPAVIAVIQCAFFGVVWASGMTFLYKYGLPEWICYIVTIIFSILPNNATLLVTIWKDVPYGISLLWVTILLAKLVTEKKESLQWGYMLQWICCLIFIYLLRQNGIVPYLLIVVALCIFTGFHKKVLIVIGASIMLIAIFQGPVLNALRVEPGYIGGKYVGLGQDILGVYFAGGEMPEGSEEIIDTLTSREGYYYTPYHARYPSYELDVPVQEFVKIYLQTFIKNPAIMTKVILCRVDFWWDIFQGKEQHTQCVNCYYTMDDEVVWTSMSPTRNSNLITRLLIKYNNNSVSVIPIYIFVWRLGIYTMLLLGGIITLIVKRQYYKIFIAIPWLGQIISLLLSTGWADYRYYWPLFLMTVFFCLCLGIGGNDSIDEKKNKIWRSL